MKAKPLELNMDEIKAWLLHCDYPLGDVTDGDMSYVTWQKIKELLKENTELKQLADEMAGALLELANPVKSNICADKLDENVCTIATEALEKYNTFKAGDND